jgi:AraC-like DNA-binding protein
MHETLRGVATGCLERSCGKSTGSIRHGAGAPGVERAEAWFSERAFEPHRHDTYAIGITLAGVQTFRYRCSRRVCLPGQLHILHPDETHDGAAGTAAGFRYRIVYIEPALIRTALGGRPLPFVHDPIQNRTAVTDPLARLLDDIDEPIGDLGRFELAATIADSLRLLSGRPDPPGSIDLKAVELVRDYLRATARSQTPASTLEELAGLDRYTIARQFRRAFGTSPDRYRTLRRLDLARKAIERGLPLAQAAAEAGFADQSHLTRQFKQTFGLTPGRWTTAVANGSSPGQPAGL